MLHQLDAVAGIQEKTIQTEKHCHPATYLTLLTRSCRKQLDSFEAHGESRDRRMKFLIPYSEIHCFYEQIQFTAVKNKKTYLQMQETEEPYVQTQAKSAELTARKTSTLKFEGGLDRCRSTTTEYELPEARLMQECKQSVRRHPRTGQRI